MSAVRTVLVAHPSADVYGSDLQLLETVTALTDSGWSVRVLLPSDGPLVPRLRERGAEVECRSFPVLRKAMMTPRGLIGLAVALVRTMPGMVRSVRRARADAVLVNTVTIPWWLLVGRLTRRLTVCHVHEAEDEGHRVVLTGLALPNLLAHRLVVNSRASGDALTRVAPRLRSRVTVVHNGFPGPADDPAPVRSRAAGDPATLVLVARLSPRKGIDVAVEAIARLTAQGRAVRLVVCGSTFPGYEWFETELRDRADEPDLAGRVEFRGYVSPTWGVLAEADIVLVPSRAEPFGNTAVEALLARRPLIASRVQGLAEIVTDGVNGLLATPGDATDLAQHIAHLLDDPALAARLADTGRTDALERFSADAYREAMITALGPRR